MARHSLLHLRIALCVAEGRDLLVEDKGMGLD